MYKYINRKIGQSDIAKLLLKDDLYLLLEFTPIALDEEGMARFRTKALLCNQYAKPYFHKNQKREDFGEVAVILRDYIQFDDLVSYIAKATLAKARKVNSSSQLTMWANQNPTSTPKLSYT